MTTSRQGGIVAADETPQTQKSISGKQVKVVRFEKLAYVSPPRPMVVKKLMAKRVSLGLLRGRIPSKNS